MKGPINTTPNSERRFALAKAQALTSSLSFVTAVIVESFLCWKALWLIFFYKSQADSVWYTCRETSGLIFQRSDAEAVHLFILSKQA